MGEEEVLTEQDSAKERYELEAKIDQALDKLFKNPNIPASIKGEFMAAAFGRVGFSAPKITKE